MSLTEIIAILALLFFAGFLAGTESALSSLSRVFIEERGAGKKRGARALAKFSSEPSRFLNVALLVRKAAEFGAAALVAQVALNQISNQREALAITVIVMVVASYVLVGVGPRTLGKQHPERWALPGAVVAVLLARVLSPVTRLLIALGNALTPGKGFKQGPFSTEAEFRDLVDQARERGFVEEDEHEMIHSVFELGDTLVREVMVPRTEMVYIERNKSLRQALSLALRSGYSRIPVIGEDLDDIVGIAYIKDLAKRSHDFREAEQLETVADLMRAANFVPENKMADELLKEMQSEQIHLAIVVDEYGGTAGLVTIEDILEEIVGEISDEFDDDDDEQLEQLSERKYRAKARIHLEDLESELGIEFENEDKEAVDTLGGLLGKHIGQVPIPGSEITIGNWRFTAERPVGRRKRVGTVLIENVVNQVQTGSDLRSESGEPSK
ncbi:MAG: HlyC/CorC family transporter [Actinobacteria bacterium]|nr:HlyC/CorC family transporter [Actinomycetota bacterium]